MVGKEHNPINNQLSACVRSEVFASNGAFQNTFLMLQVQFSILVDIFLGQKEMKRLWLRVKLNQKMLTAVWIVLEWGL